MLLVRVFTYLLTSCLCPFSAGLGEDFDDVEDDENIEELDQQEVSKHKSKISHIDLTRILLRYHHNGDRVLSPSSTSLSWKCYATCCTILLLQPFNFFSQEEAENVDILAAGAAGGGVAKTKRITTRYMTKYVYNVGFVFEAIYLLVYYLQNIHLIFFNLF